MGWTMLYLFVFLKLPILAACYIVWWAIHQTGDVDEVPSDTGGSCEASAGGEPCWSLWTNASTPTSFTAWLVLFTIRMVNGALLPAG